MNNNTDPSHNVPNKRERKHKDIFKGKKLQTIPQNFEHLSNG